MAIKISKTKRIRWGAAGCGRFTETAFIPSITQLRKNKLVSLFSNDKERAKTVANKFGIPNYYNNYDEFLKSDIDAVYIGSANHHHYDQVIKAADAGKHILCEKPLALNSEEAGEMIKICEKNKVLLSVNYVYRFHPLVMKAKEIIDNQMLGKIISINLSFNIDLLPGNNFRYRKEESGGGALRDLGTHMIDLLRFWGGEITDIKGFLDTIVYKSEVEDFAAALVKFEKNGYGYLNVSYNSKKAINRAEIIGHKGSISFEKLIASRYSTVKLTILLDGEGTKSFRKRANKFLHSLKSFQKSILNNEPLAVSGYDGLINLKLIEKLEMENLR